MNVCVCMGVCAWVCISRWVAVCACVCRRESVCVRLSERECVFGESGNTKSVLRKRLTLDRMKNRSIKVVALQKPYQLKVENIVD